MKFAGLSRYHLFFRSLGLLVALSTVSLLAQTGARLDHRRVDQFFNSAGEVATIKSKADWEKRKAAVLENMQKVMGPLPAQAKQELPVTYEVLSETAGEGYRRLTIKFAAEPGDPVVADLYLPESLKAGEKRAGVVALHPTGEMGKRIVAGEAGKANRQYGLELAQRGYVVICPDYPSFGDLKTYDFASDDYISGTMKGIVNHMRCVDLLRSLEQVDGERIGTIGHSLGGHNALFLAAFDDRVKVIVSSCGWTPFHDYKQGNVTGWTSERYMPLIKTEYDLDPDKIPFDFPEIIASLAPRPFFSSSPVDDDNFDVAGVRKGVEAAKFIYNLFGVPEELHLDEPLCDHDFPTEVRSDAYAFMDRVLKHQPERQLDFGADLPRIAALSPAEAMSSFRIAPGYRLEQTAAEPLVVDPVAMCFDENGRLFVVEMRDYSEDDGQNLGRIRVLEDTDRDGRFDQSTVYAEGLSWPTAVFCYNGGIFVGAAPDIYYLKDTNGDLVADTKELIFTGFGKRNVQALLNSFRWGLDNRIYGATSANGGMIRRPDQPESEAINLSGRNFSFDPVTLELRPESGAAQHGMGFDDWGRLFVCSNGDHFQMVMYQDRYAARNPSLKSPPGKMSVADDGRQATVYRISPVEPWRVVRTRLRASGRVKGAVEFGGKNSGYFTSATGVNFFRGDGWNDSEKGMAIVGDVGSNIVHRKRVFSDGVVIRGDRVDENSELISSTDIWFRPVQYENGPDGALHVLDMYREVIEHPWSFPPEIKQHLDLTSGRDRGRLYRLVKQDYQHRPCPQLGSATTAELVELLNHPNAWHRETASRLLFERQDLTAAGLIREKIAGFSPLGQMHGLYALLGQRQLKAEDLLPALKSAEPRLREHAVLLSENFTSDSGIREQLAKMVDDADPGVRYQLAFSLGEFPADWNAPLIARMLVQDGDSFWIRFALLSSLKDQIPAVLDSLVKTNGYQSAAGTKTVLTEIVELIARRARPAEVNQFAAVLLSGKDLSDIEKRSLYQTYAMNISRRGEQGQESTELNAWRQRFLEQARDAAADEKLPVAKRIAGIKALTVSREEKDAELLLEMLAPYEPVEIQTEALNALVAMEGQGTDRYLIENWAGLGPELRKAAQQALFSRPAWTISYLKAVLSGDIPRSDVDRAQLQVLKSSKSKEIQEISGQVLTFLQDSPRKEVIEKYRPAMELAGEIEHGRALFVKHCSSCHQLEGVGKPIGPNLSSFKNRGKEAFLINMLDPSREVTPDYINYLVITADGRSYTGLLAAQNATTISLQRAEGEPITILRSDIEEMRSSGISLMPEGLEKDIDVKALGDLLTYLMQTE